MTAVERQKLVESLYTLLTYERPSLTAHYCWNLYCELESFSVRRLDVSVLFSRFDNTPEGLIPYADRDQYTTIESRPISTFKLRLRSRAEISEEALVTLLHERRFGGFTLLHKQDVRRFILLNSHLMNLSVNNLNVSLDATIVFLVSHSSSELRVSLEERFLLRKELFQKLREKSVAPPRAKLRKKKNKQKLAATRAALFTTGVIVKGKFKVVSGVGRSTGRVATSLTIKKLQTLLRAEGEGVTGLSKKDLCAALEKVLGERGRLKVL